MFPELRFGWHANDGALKSLQGVFQQYLAQSGRAKDLHSPSSGGSNNEGSSGEGVAMRLRLAGVKPNSAAIRIMSSACLLAMAT
jgi:hypothetical protein